MRRGGVDVSTPRTSQDESGNRLPTPFRPSFSLLSQRSAPMRSRCTIRPLCFVLRKRCWVLALTVTLTLASASPTRAGSMDVNGAAFGSFTVNVWCNPNAPPAAPTYTSTDGAAGGVFFPSASLGPNLMGCNAVTQITGSARAAAALFGANVKYTQGGGDITG